jgi:mono/diheme cytochrome c family protein
MSTSNSKSDSRSPIGSGALVPVVLIGAVVLVSAATLARSQDKVAAGMEVWKSSGCSDCHGSFADGNTEDGDFPVGANLRTTRLDTAGLKLTISCGRPGTGMPSFDEGAYKLRACYGQPLGAAPDNLQPTPRTLSLNEIDALIAYLQARIIGRGKITREECLAYFGDALSSSCGDLK